MARWGTRLLPAQAEEADMAKSGDKPKKEAKKPKADKAAKPVATGGFSGGSLKPGAGKKDK